MPVNIDGVLFLHITDTYKASYEVRVIHSVDEVHHPQQHVAYIILMMSLLQVEDPEFALTQLCLTSTRGELGKLPVDQLFKVEHGDFFP